ncbi:MAG: ThuA domain-containing protein [Novosphingobium sp.]
MHRGVLAAGIGAALGLTSVPAAAARGRAPAARPAVLVFTKAAGFVHKSIVPGTEAIRKLGAENGFTVDATADPTAFTPENLARYKAVIFLSTTGNVLPGDAQRAALEGYIRGGGGYFGIHAASDMGGVAQSWPFYLGLVGAAFKGHTNARLYTDNALPNRPGLTYGGKLAQAPADADQAAPGMKASSSEPARVVVEDRASPLTRGWGGAVTLTDEWYGFASNPRPHVHVIARVDEATYTPGPGQMGADHPVAWCRAYEGGRSVYTALGHPIGAWSDPRVLSHVLGGIRLAAGIVPFRC